MKHTICVMLCLSVLLVLGTANQISAYQVTLSPYNQEFDINKFYNDGDFDVDAGIVEGDPTVLLVIVGDPANVEEILKIPEIPDPFLLADAGSDFHFEVFQPFRFQDRFDGLFSTTVDDPVLFVPDNGTVTSFRDDGLLADDRIDLTAYAAELPEEYYEVDWGDTITMTTNDGTTLYISRFWRLPDFTIQFDISDVPEPGMIVLVGLGLAGIIGMMRRKKMMDIKTTRLFGILLVLTVGFILLSVPKPIYAIEVGEGAPPGFPGTGINPKNEFIKAFNEAQNIYGENVLGNPTDIVKQRAGIRFYQQFENGSIEYKILGSAYAVCGPIYNKWIKKVNQVGFPKNHVAGAWGSPQGTGGKVQFFEYGDIYLHETGKYVGRAFEVHGAILGVYNGNGGTGDIGFPLTDELPDGPFGKGIAVSYFEGDHCITSQDEIDYELFTNCKQGQPLGPPKLVDANARCVKCDKSLDEQKKNFDFTWKPYTPKSPKYSFTPSKFEMSYFSDFMSDEKDVTILAKAENHESDPVTTRVTVVNEDYEVSIGFEISGIEEDDNQQEEFSITLTMGSGSGGPSYTFYLKPSDIRLRNWSFLNQISDLKKRETVHEILDELDDAFEVAEDFIKGTDTFKGLLRKLNKGMNVFSKLPVKACKTNGPSFGVSAGWNFSKLCCTDYIKVSHGPSLGGGGSIGSVECETPPGSEFAVFPGIFIGLTAELGISVGVSLKGKTTCKSFQVCGDVDLAVEPSDLGVYLAVVHKKIARFDLKGALNPSVSVNDLCVNPVEVGKAGVCIKPKVTGEVTLFSFITKGVDANIKGKMCWPKN